VVFSVFTIGFGVYFSLSKLINESKFFLKSYQAVNFLSLSLSSLFLVSSFTSYSTKSPYPYCCYFIYDLDIFPDFGRSAFVLLIQNTKMELSTFTLQQSIYCLPIKKFLPPRLIMRLVQLFRNFSVSHAHISI